MQYIADIHFISTKGSIVSLMSSQMILLISSMPGAESCAANLSHQLGCRIDLSLNRKAGIAMLKNESYSFVVVDDAIAEIDLRGAEILWRYSGLALPLQINFALSGTGRLVRDIRAALHRSEKEIDLAGRAAACVLESQLKSTLTGLLLQSQLALAEPALTAPIATKLRIVIELAGILRQDLDRAHALTMSIT